MGTLIKLSASDFLKKLNLDEENQKLMSDISIERDVNNLKKIKKSHKHISKLTKAPEAVPVNISVDFDTLKNTLPLKRTLSLDFNDLDFNIKPKPTNSKLSRNEKGEGPASIR